MLAAAGLAGGVDEVGEEVAQLEGAASGVGDLFVGAELPEEVGSGEGVEGVGGGGGPWGRPARRAAGSR